MRGHTLLSLLVAAAWSLTASATLAAEPAPATAPPAKGELNADQPEQEKRGKDLRVGALLGVGFPRPLAIEGIVRIHEVFAVGAEYGFMPTMTIAGVDTRFKGAALDLRLFPLRGSFFIGLRGGRQWLDMSTTLTALGRSSVETMEAATWFLNPRIGFLQTWDNGITVGIDAGVQIPINPTFVRSGLAERAGLSGDVDQTLASIAGTLGNKVTPTIDLLRLGFLF